MTELLPFIALLIGTVALIASIIVWLSVANIKRHLRGHGPKYGLDNAADGRRCNADEEVVGVERNSDSLGLEQTENQTADSVKSPVSYELPTETFNMIVETVVTAVEDNIRKNHFAILQKDASNVASDGTGPSEDASSEMELPDTEPQEQKVYQYQYASAYDAEKRTFYKVEKEPFDGAIYKIAVDPTNDSKGILELYLDATEQMVQCRDFLDYCCETSGTGMSISTIERGSVINNNGAWQIENKLKVKFE